MLRKIKKVLKGELEVYWQRNLWKKAVNGYNRLLLFVLYYLVFSPIAVSLRLAGLAFLPVKETRSSSYWKHKKNRSKTGRYR